MWYIEWYKYEGKQGVTKGRLAVYFRSESQAYQAMRSWLSYSSSKTDGCEVKQKS